MNVFIKNSVMAKEYMNFKIKLPELSFSGVPKDSI